jgi:replication factor C subunit 3/5
MNINKEYIPFVEKYRPNEFENIVLDVNNKIILNNIIEKLYFPNLLLYGPPGTGKTTTIINLINSYQDKIKNKDKNLIIHLNASDERGIDIIRHQINNFVNSKALFNNGMKFVILDEVDYMTKSAQQALRYLLQSYNNNVRFCLICNYISKIDEALQNEFITLRFNQLPREEIIKYIKNISNKENLNLTEDSINNIQNIFKSDMRSMINFIQTNIDIKEKIKIIDNNILEDLLITIKKEKDNELIISLINEISLTYNIDKKNLLKLLFNYIIKFHDEVIRIDLLDFIENLLHNEIENNDIIINYTISKLSLLLDILE